MIDCLEAALWAFYHGSIFREGALLAVNLDDADTTGAVYASSPVLITARAEGQNFLPLFTG